MEYHQLTGDVALVQEPEGRMQAEVVVERQRTIGHARRGDRELTMQS